MKTNTALKIVALCVICAATMMTGCLGVDDPAETANQPTVASVFDEMEDNFAEAEEIKARAQEVLKADKLISDVIESSPETKSSIPDDYYNITVDQYFIDYKLYGYLDSYTWGRPISVGSWSFREAAELEHELTEKGCNVKIRWADCRTTIDHTDFEARVKTDGYNRWGGLPEMDQVSCWLMIELHGEWVAYSPTGCYWIFDPAYGKNEYVSGGKWHDNWYYTEGTTSTWDGCTWTSHGFIDFDDIYELEAYFISGEMQTRYDVDDMNGVWWTYVESDEYNATDDFMISFGWWMTEDEYHDTETRINKATEWFELVD